MTARQIAIINVFKILAIALGTGLVTVALLKTFTIPQLGIAFCVLCILFMLKTIYDIELMRAESLDRLNKMK